MMAERSIPISGKVFPDKGYLLLIFPAANLRGQASKHGGIVGA